MLREEVDLLVRACSCRWCEGFDVVCAVGVQDFSSGSASGKSQGGCSRWWSLLIAADSNPQVTSGMKTSEAGVAPKLV